MVTDKTAANQQGPQSHRGRFWNRCTCCPAKRNMERWVTTWRVRVVGSVVPESVEHREATRYRVKAIRRPVR
jgi:hypothetical protein